MRQSGEAGEADERAQQDRIFMQFRDRILALKAASGPSEELHDLGMWVAGILKEPCMSIHLLELDKPERRQ